MSAFEIIYTLTMFVGCILMAKSAAKGSVSVGVFAFLALFAMLMVPFALLSGWPRRLKTYRMKKGATHHKHVSYRGFFTDIRQFKTGKMVTKAVSDGFTQEIGGNYSVYEHYHYETAPQYDGFVGAFHLCDQEGNETGALKIIRTFPKDRAVLPDTGRKPIVISCVVDDDGTEYYNDL